MFAVPATKPLFDGPEPSAFPETVAIAPTPGCCLVRDIALTVFVFAFKAAEGAI